ncbi:MAG: hypothetical protein ACTSUE_11720 [Promethearchaeota archaeon]
MDCFIRDIEIFAIKPWHHIGAIPALSWEQLMNIDAINAQNIDKIQGITQLVNQLVK